ncbi:hypothetical protein QTS76_36820, partial [Micromonospora sp. b486]|nr:hypothetical protein [Micromonospora sp. b486]
MQTVFSTVLPDMPAAAVIWLVLLAVAATVVAALIVRPSRFRSELVERISDAAGRAASNAPSAPAYGTGNGSATRRDGGGGLPCDGDR